MLRAWLRQQRRRFSVFPPVGAVYFGSLNRTRPISRVFGFDRGGPIDRYYIEGFLAEHTHDVRGVVLEVGDDSYTRRFGDQRVVRSEVVHREPGHAGVTIVADLGAAGSRLGCEVFDCMILTQTLHVIYDVRAAIDTVYQALKPGGVLLATVPGITQVSRYDMQRWGDFWRFTDVAVSRLLSETFGSEHVQVRARGNVFAAISLLHGLAQEDIDTRKLEPDDPDYPVIITIRATRPDAR